MAGGIQNGRCVTVPHHVIISPSLYQWPVLSSYTDNQNTTRISNYILNKHLKNGQYLYLILAIYLLFCLHVQSTDLPRSGDIFS